MVLIATSLILFIYLYQRKLIKRKLEYQKIEELLNQQELSSAYAILEGQDKERKRIAQDLHDNLGSLLVTLNMYSDALLQKQPPEDIKGLVEKIRTIALQANEETRTLSHSLDSGALRHFGIETALNDLANAVREAKSLQFDLEVSLEQLDDVDLSLNLYRIAQELVNNTLKHAQASRISLELTEIQNKRLSLIYQDNGIGYNPEEVKEKGMGLKNLKARVEKINGTLTTETRIGKGTTIIIEIES